MIEPGIGIVMRSMNEQPHVGRALAALRAQEWRDWALYAVDSGSTDGTDREIEAFGPRRMARIAPSEYVPGRVLNRMIADAPHGVIVLLNADAVPVDAHWLGRLAAPVLDGRADAAMSRQTARADAHWVVADDYARAYDPRNIKAGNADFFSAVACAFRRSLWERQPFPESGYAEDVAWARSCRAAGARIELVMDSVVEHSHNYSLRGLYKKKFRHGETFARVYGARPSAWRQALACAKEIARDTLRCTAAGRPWTIPYNLAYRSVIHTALHQGRRAGWRTGA